MAGISFWGILVRNSGHANWAGGNAALDGLLLSGWLGGKGQQRTFSLEVVVLAIHDAHRRQGYLRPEAARAGMDSEVGILPHSPNARAT